MATTVQPQAGQPVYLPPGTAPPATVAMQPNPAASGTIMYYPPGTAGVPQGAVVMVSCSLFNGYSHTQASHSMAQENPGTHTSNAALSPGSPVSPFLERLVTV